MRVRYALLPGVLLLFVPSSRADDKPTVDQSQFPPTYVPSGEDMYRQFCAACHGADAKGHGPAADSLKRPPADLTTLAQRHGGKFPYDYVSNVLLFGPGITANGSAVMPTWGPIFLYLDKHNEAAAQHRNQEPPQLFGVLASRSKTARTGTCVHTLILHGRLRTSLGVPRSFLTESRATLTILPLQQSSK